MERIMVPVFDCKAYEREYYFDDSKLQFEFFESRLNTQTADLAKGAKAIAAFVNDQLDKNCLQKLKSNGVELICLRSAGYNNVDLEQANNLGIRICRVPSYSPHSVAEFTLLQMLCLTRKIHRSYQRTRDLNFSLDGLVGSTIKGKTIGVIGTGQIGSALVELLEGFDAKVLAVDPNPNPILQERSWVSYENLDTALKESDILSLHAPLNKTTYHLINQERLETMKSGVLLINTGRGGLVESRALIKCLKSGKIGGAALDVYEEEENYFFSDFSEKGVDDDTLARLVSFPNVLVTSHQAYLTDVSLKEISNTTRQSLTEWANGTDLSFQITI